MIDLANTNVALKYFHTKSIEESCFDLTALKSMS